MGCNGANDNDGDPNFFMENLGTTYFTEQDTLPKTNRSRRAQVPVTKKHMRLQLPMELRVWLHRGLFFQTPKLVLFVLYTCQAQAIPSWARNSCGVFTPVWTRVTLQVWTCVKYVPKQSIPQHFEDGLQVWTCVKYVPKQSIPQHFEDGLHYRFGHV